MSRPLVHLLMKYSPEWLLEFAKRQKKLLRKKELRAQEQSGGFTKEDLIRDLKNTGIQPGDSLLVHCSLSKIGFIHGGPDTLIQALLETLGKEGTLLMPSFPAGGRNKDYIETNKVFDVRLTPSAMGKVSETFRLMPGVHRSLHPTDPVCAYGPLAKFYTETHFGQLTPYNEFSPFRKLADKHGKILMLGTTLNGAGTSLHTLEDAVDFPYPVYDKNIYEVTIIDENGKEHQVKTKVHNPTQSAKRNCDALKPGFISAGVLKEYTIGQAQSLLIDAAGMFQTMLTNFKERGVTMYTPYGNK